MSEEHFVRRSTRSTVSKKRSLVDFEDPGESSTAISTASTTRTKSTKKSKTSKSKTSAPDKYAHLKGVPDAIDYNLICLLIGLNPGIKTAEVGHAYSHPGNRFWKFLHSSCLTPDRLLPSTDDQLLPSQYALGTTNIVGRPTEGQADLSKKELDEGVPELDRKLRKYRAEAVCIVGKGIWESIYRVRHNGAKVDSKKFSYGWQGDEQNMGQIEKGARLDADGNFVTENATVVEKDGWGGARVYVVPSTSGLVTIPQATQREVWGKLGEWVNKRREERKQSGITAGNQKD